MRRVYSRSIGDGNLNVMIEGADDAVQALYNMSETAKTQFEYMLEGAAKSTTEVMKSEAPHATGEFRETISYDVDMSELKAEIGPSNDQYGGRHVGRAIEFGRPPGSRPPVGALMARYPYLSIGQAVAAAKTIARRGIKPNSFIFRTYYETREILYNFGIQAMYGITAVW